MNVAIFMCEDYNFTIPAVLEMIPLIEETDNVVGVCMFPDPLMTYNYYLNTFGVEVFLKLCFKTIKKFIANAWSFKKLNKITFDNPNDEEVIDWLIDNDVDVVISLIGHIYKKDILDTVCVLNKHSSLLPAHKGVLPVFWVLKNNDKVGVTIHKMTEKLDSGDIILQKSYGKKDTVYDYYEAIYQDVPELFAKSIHLITKAKVQHGKSSYHSLPTKGDYEEFKSGGNRFI